MTGTSAEDWALNTAVASAVSGRGLLLCYLVVAVPAAALAVWHLSRAHS